MFCFSNNDCSGYSINLLEGTEGVVKFGLGSWCGGGCGGGGIVEAEEI